MAKATEVQLAAGTLLEPGSSLRKKPYVGPETHASARHGGATWLPEHDIERQREEARLERKFGKPRIPFADRSTFSSASLIPEILAMSAEKLGIVGYGGKNVIVMFDAGFDIGYDARNRMSTSLVTVIVKLTGEVVTAFPGRLDADQIPMPLVPRKG